MTVYRLIRIIFGASGRNFSFKTFRYFIVLCLRMSVSVDFAQQLIPQIITGDDLQLFLPVIVSYSQLFNQCSELSREVKQTYNIQKYMWHRSYVIISRAYHCSDLSSFRTLKFPEAKRFTNDKVHLHNARLSMTCCKMSITVAIRCFQMSVKSGIINIYFTLLAEKQQLGLH